MRRKQWQIKPVEFRFHADERAGQLKGEKHNSDGLVLKFLELLYVDDTFFPFKTRSDLIKGAGKIYFLFERFGLHMHIGRGDDDSKTKAMYFPPSVPIQQKKKKNPTPSTSDPQPDTPPTTADTTTAASTAPTSKQDERYELPQHVSTSQTASSPSPTPSPTWAPSLPMIYATLSTSTRTLKRPPPKWEPSDPSSDTPTSTSRPRRKYISALQSTQSSGVASHGP
jgi:hypothetical protein